MNLQQFKSESLAQRSVSKYSSTGNSWKDGGFLGECVSEVNQLCYRVLNVPAGAWGNAKDWANDSNPNRAYFDKVSGIQAGDLIVYPGSFGAGDGHIAIALGNGQMLDQNSDDTGTVKVHGIWSGYSAILRHKGDDDVNAQQIAETRKQQLDKIAQAVSYPNADSGIDGILGNISTLQEAFAKLPQVQQQLDAANATIKQLQAGAKTLAKGTYLVQ